ncbi:MAG: hypothetical protein JNL44_15940 [Gemmatimonadetes bacterium]|nr:hypothetical protein [Gemmatimonadota bacterium]
MITSAMFGTNLPPREPEQRCEACGAQGTVGRAVRFEEDGEAKELHRFCRACWPEERARYQARWDEEDRLATEAFFRSGVTGGHASPSRAFEAATWHGVLDVLHEIQRQMAPHQPPSPESLQALARSWEALAKEIEDPMPLELEWFVRAHVPRAG